MAWTQILCASAILIGLTKGYAPYHDPNYAPGRDVIVHLFEWRWDDIAKECETFLSPMGYAGVQVSPPTENAIIDEPNGMHRPWYERYKPVSYKLVSRSGNEDQFKDMVRRCNKVGIRIYVDVVISHMAGNFSDKAVGTAGSKFNCTAQTFDAVPYGPEDFNNGACTSKSGTIEDVHDINQMRYCKNLLSNDLNQGKDSVRKSISTFLNHLLDIGVAGFRIHAAKYMWPDDLAAIYASLNNLSSTYFQPNARPFIMHAITDQGTDAVKSRDYVNIGRVTEFMYALKLGEIFRGEDKLCYTKNFGEDWSFVNSDDAVVFIDHPESQRGLTGRKIILSFLVPELYKKAVVFMMAWPYGLKRIMSSYKWKQMINQDGNDTNVLAGPPHDENYNILPVEIGADGLCSNDWVCEHRWPLIAQMVQFSIVAQNDPVANWWDNANQQIAFSRGNKAFLVINAEDKQLSQTLNTNLAQGMYCDILSGIYTNEICTGRLYTVTPDSRLRLNIPIGMVALHVQSMFKVKPNSPETEISKALPPGFRRTVVFVQIDGITAADTVYILGGLVENDDCKVDKKCTIPIIHTATLSWKTEDRELSWDDNTVKSGAGSGQRGPSRAGGPAQAGGPLPNSLFLSTNNNQSTLFHPENNFGDVLWTLDVLMDCTKVDYGWFGFKIYMSNRANPWESDINQADECSGSTYKAQLPFVSNNHLALCGQVNFFTYEKNDCMIQGFNM